MSQNSAADAWCWAQCEAKKIAYVPGTVIPEDTCEMVWNEIKLLAHSYGLRINDEYELDPNEESLLENKIANCDEVAYQYIKGEWVESDEGDEFSNSPYYTKDYKVVDGVWILNEDI